MPSVANTAILLALAAIGAIAAPVAPAGDVAQLEPRAGNIFKGPKPVLADGNKPRKPVSPLPTIGESSREGVRLPGLSAGSRAGRHYGMAADKLPKRPSHKSTTPTSGTRNAPTRAETTPKNPYGRVGRKLRRDVAQLEARAGNIFKGPKPVLADGNKPRKPVSPLPTIGESSREGTRLPGLRAGSRAGRHYGMAADKLPKRPSHKSTTPTSGTRNAPTRAETTPKNPYGRVPRKSRRDVAQLEARAGNIFKGPKGVLADGNKPRKPLHIMGTVPEGRREGTRGPTLLRTGRGGEHPNMAADKLPKRPSMKSTTPTSGTRNAPTRAEITPKNNPYGRVARKPKA